MQTQTSNTLHNAIMEAGSKDRPPMLAPDKVVPNSDGSLTTTTERVFETYKNVTRDIRDQLNAEAEAVQIILTGKDNDIYSTVDACLNACEMWKAIERLKQGKSINVQDLETNLYWEFGKFTSQDGESLESYYSRFYKMMNELIRNQCKVTNHQVNVQFLLQLQPEWQRFVTLVKQSQELKTVSYHKLYDILKQHQHEVNDIRAEKIASVANPLALVAQQQKSIILKLILLITLRIPQPDHNKLLPGTEEKQLSTLHNPSMIKNIQCRANQDNSPRINRNDGYENQKNGTVAGARETVGSTVGQKSGIQCYNCKEFGHVARECQKPKRVKDAAYHKEKMLLCKQEEAGIQLNAEQADWRDDTDDDELEDQELEVHYMYMAQLQEVSPNVVDSRPIFKIEPVQKLVEIVLFIVDFGCSKHMTGNLKLLINFVKKFLGTVKFRNDHIAPILGYGDLVQGAVMIKRVYYFEGLNHNLFSVGQFCDANLEVAFRKSTCYIHDLKGNNLLTGSRGMDLYSIKLQDTNSPNQICLMAKVTSSQAWLWHRRLSHLNFDTINLLSKNDIVIHFDSFLRSKDETPEVLIDFLRLVQRGLQAQVRVVRIDKGTKFLNQTLHAYFVVEGILHQTAAKVPLFFWAEAIATACFTQNRSLVIPRHEKTPYHIINDRKPSVKFFYNFGSTCYIVIDGENLDKMKEKGDECIFMASDQLSSDPAPECQTMALNHDSLSSASQRQANVPQADRTVTTSNELDLLFSLMFDELLNGSSKVVSQSSAVSAVDAPNQRQHHTTPLNIHTTPTPTYDEFINIFSTPTKDHPLEQVIGNPSQSVRTRRQLESDAEMCMFALTVSRTEPKNIKEAMADSFLIESMQKELHQFYRLDVWELVDRPLCTNVINLKWLWKNKCDEENTVIRNKYRLVAKGYAQKEGVDFEESFAPVARL
nr:Gag-Pol polyprotein [Tanacetum cinerariifolium]